MPQPVATFLSLSLSLKTALAECLDNPTPKTVHWLRATIRRIQATIDLLIDTADLPTLPKRSKRFSESLRRVRRATGKVRDLDAHGELLTDYKATMGADDLTKHLEATRNIKVQQLQNRIRKDQQDIYRNLDKLETTLASANSLNLSGGILIHLATSSLVPALRGLDPNDDDDLHSIRKACKTARYIAEIGAESSKAASGLAKRLQKYQKIIGAWHDHLVLCDESRESLPNDSPLTAKLHAKTGSLRRHAESKAVGIMTIKRSVSV
jgi:CHAD domain-containing protein